MHSKYNEIILRGGCDITAIAWFLRKEKLNIQDKNHLGIWVPSYSEYLAQAARGSSHLLPFVNSAVYPNQNLFSIHNSLLIVSALSEPCAGYYKSSADGTTLMRGQSCADMNADFYCECISPSSWKRISHLYQFCGRIPVSDVISNYKDFLGALQPSVDVCIVLGPTFGPFFGEESAPLKEKARNYYACLNNALRAEFSSRRNVRFLDPADALFVPKKSTDIFYNGFQSIAHYSRKTYLNMAKILRKFYGKKAFKIDYGKILRRFFRKTAASVLAFCRKES